MERFDTIERDQHRFNAVASAVTAMGFAIVEGVLSIKNAVETSQAHPTSLGEFAIVAGGTALAGVAAVHSQRETARADRIDQGLALRRQ